VAPLEITVADRIKSAEAVPTVPCRYAVEPKGPYARKKVAVEENVELPAVIAFATNTPLVAVINAVVLNVSVTIGACVVQVPVHPSGYVESYRISLPAFKRGASAFASVFTDTSDFL
jgi:hypothetical protein